MDSTGERLRILREREGKTQEEISGILGTTQQIYSRYETGRNDLPLRHLKCLIQYYDVSADYILGRTSVPNAPPELSESFLQNVTVSDFITHVSSFSSTSKKMLIEYTNYLAWRESAEKKKQ